MKQAMILAAILFLHGIAAAQAASDNVPSNFLPGVRSATVETISSEINHRESAETGIIALWRDRMDKAVILAPRTYPSEQAADRLQSMDERNELANEGRAVSKIAFRETLKIAQEQFPELDRLIKVLKLEVSTELISDVGATSGIEMRKAPVQQVTLQKPVETRFFMKTGLRIPVENGKVNLLSETTAVYGNISSYVRVQVGGRGDSRLGVIYAMNHDMHLQIEHQLNRSAGSGQTMNAATLDVVQLMCVF